MNESGFNADSVGVSSRYDASLICMRACEHASMRIRMLLLLLMTTRPG
jgi:hypothetical protein